MVMFSTKAPFDLAEFLSQPASDQIRSSLATRRRNQARADKYRESIGYVDEKESTE